MKITDRKHMAFWSITGLFAGLMVFSGILYVSGAPMVREALTRLGYPAYMQASYYWPSSSFSNASSRRLRGNTTSRAWRRTSQTPAATDPDAHQNHADDQKPIVAEGLLVDPQAEEDDGHRTDPAQQHHDERPAGYRRPVIELRHTPVELISKRLAKALLAPRLRPVAHIHRAPREQGGGRAANPNDEIPTGHHFAIAGNNHHAEENRHTATRPALAT